MDHPNFLIDRAYRLAWRHLSKGERSPRQLVARLTVQGIPGDLAEQVVNQVIDHHPRQNHDPLPDLISFGVFMFSLAAIILITSVVLTSTIIVVPSLFFVGMTITVVGALRSLRQH